MGTLEDFQGVPPLPPRYRLRDLLWGGDSIPADDDRVRVEFFTNEKSFKERLQLYFIKNQRSSLRIRIFNFIIKLLSCILYVVRVSLNTHYAGVVKPCIGCDGNQTSSAELPPMVLIPNDCNEPPDSIKWSVMLWVERSLWLWGIQVFVAIVSLMETLLLTYLGYKGNILQQILAWGFLLELVNTLPFIVTIFVPQIRDVYIPVFLNCWLAKSALQNMLNDLHRALQRTQSALSQQLVVLSATLFCLVFTSVCGIEHLQRGGGRQFDLFDSLWYVIVTFTTVGYGDIYPDIWPSKVFMMFLIISAFVVLPTQLEQLALTWMDREKQGGTYSSHRAQNEKHVVVVATTLHTDTIMDFLNEFYAHPKLQDYYVVLLSPSELDATMKTLLQVPLWAARVIYIQGSALKDSDLSRCRMQDAEACFTIAARNYTDRTAADEHTIMRTWAVRDFAPHCPQYVHIFRTENKMHVQFSEHVVCEDEFKYALLANNCLCPGASTLITLLLHTSRGLEGQGTSEDWMKLYGTCSGNEIYHIQLGESRFFREYKGKSFTYASFHAHRKYGVSLVGIKQNMPGATILLNPGSHYNLAEDDTCFYMSITKEENSTFIQSQSNTEKNVSGSKDLESGGGSYSKVSSMIARVGTVALELQHTRAANPTRTTSTSNKLELPEGLTIQSLNKRPSIAPVPEILSSAGFFSAAQQDEEDDNDEDKTEDEVDGDTRDSSSSSDATVLPAITTSASDADAGSGGRPSASSTCDDYKKDDNGVKIRSGFPPVTPYIGTSPTLCHLLCKKKPYCCLQLKQPCRHFEGYTSAQCYKWKNRSVIVAADFASNALYNFIVPLRSHCRPKESLQPIVLLLEKGPDQSFLECICHFPRVYWMIGSIDSVDDLLVAGINLADNVVIVNKESSNSMEEDTLADCNTIVAVQTIFRLFPCANIITELTQASNMRFMQFRAKDHYALQLSKLEKKEKDKGSHLYYMFRLPFAAGNVFSASMLDTLLYQAFVKDYLITFVRLLLGIDQAVGSGHLSCMKIREDDLWIRTYGRLYQKLCSTTCEIPIGIYRTQHQKNNAANGHTLSETGECLVCRASGRKRSFRRRAGHTSQGQGSESNDHGRTRSWSKSSWSKASFKSNKGCCYRQVSINVDDEHGGKNHMIERQEIRQMVHSRMNRMSLPLYNYNEKSSKRDTFHYVIINPGYDQRLEVDDIIYLIRPSSLLPDPSPMVEQRRFVPHTKDKRLEPTGAEDASLRMDSLSKTPLVRVETEPEGDLENEVFVSAAANPALSGTIV